MNGMNFIGIDNKSPSMCVNGMEHHYAVEAILPIPTNPDIRRTPTRGLAMDYSGTVLLPVKSHFQKRHDENTQLDCAGTYH